MSGFGCQGKELLDSETCHPTPENYINCWRACCPSGATFFEHILGKSLVIRGRVIYAKSHRFAIGILDKDIDKQIDSIINSLNNTII